MTTTTVKGSVMATYNHHWASPTNLRPKTDDIKVPGRNTIVSAAMVFIDELSALVSRAIRVVVALSC
jgi:hypothetical protein